MLARGQSPGWQLEQRQQSWPRSAHTAACLPSSMQQLSVACGVTVAGETGVSGSRGPPPPPPHWPAHGLCHMTYLLALALHEAAARQVGTVAPHRRHCVRQQDLLLSSWACMCESTPQHGTAQQVPRCGARQAQHC